MRTASNRRHPKNSNFCDPNDMARMSIFYSIEAAAQVKSAPLQGIGVETHTLKMQRGVGKQCVNQSAANLLPA